MTGVTPPVVMTIGDSDSCGASGIQADLKTLASMRVYGATVVTAISSQNTRYTVDVYPLPANVVASQISAVLEDLPVAAAQVDPERVQRLVVAASGGDPRPTRSSQCWKMSNA